MTNGQSIYSLVPRVLLWWGAGFWSCYNNWEKNGSKEHSVICVMICAQFEMLSKQLEDLLHPQNITCQFSRCDSWTFQDHKVHKNESFIVFEWVLEVRYVDVQGNTLHMHWKKLTVAYKVNQASSTEVCHTKCSRQNVIFCAAQREGEPDEEGIKRLRFLVDAKISQAEMSFQHEEQDLDFSYMFEYNQDVPNESEPGGYVQQFWTLYFLYCISCLLQCQSAAVQWD